MNKLRKEILAVLGEQVMTYLHLEDLCNCWNTPGDLRQELSDMQADGVLEMVRHPEVPGRVGYSRKRTRAEISFTALQGRICDLLSERGPMGLDDIRETLCVASKLKFTAAMTGLTQAKTIERHPSAAARIFGDTRPWPGPGSLNAKYQRRLDRQKAEKAGHSENYYQELGAKIVEEALATSH